MSSMWAQSTWKDRGRLWKRYAQFLQQKLGREVSNGIDPQSALMFLESLDVSIQAKRKYAKTLLARHKSMTGETLQDLKNYSEGLLGQGAAVPKRQALAMARSDLEYFSIGQPPHLRWPLFLAWKTASRWDEIVQLTGSSFLKIDPQEVIIQWGRNTKTSRKDPFRATGFAVIHHNSPMTKLCEYLGQFSDAEPITNIETTTLNRIFKQFATMKKYSAHSIKRGAVDLLIKAAADGKLDPRLIPLLAKHKDDLMNFPSSTLRYTSDKVALAKMLKTQLATILL